MTDEKYYGKRYSIYKMGETFATGIPKEIIESEARRRDMSPDDFKDQFKVEVQYNNFEGAKITFVEKEGED